jgi:hypothetical protein
MIFLNKEEIEKRHKICESCEYFDKLNEKCKKCGCYTRLKVMFKYSSCPINKW